MSDVSCQLCTAEKLTKRYYEDDCWWIADCLTCNVPLVVYKGHTVQVLVVDLDVIYKAIQGIFPGLKMEHFDFDRRSIPNHYHFHIRGL